MSENKEFKATVMPREDKNQQGSLPGIVLPENPETIEAFSQINSTSSKELNERINAEIARKKENAKKD